MQHACWGVRCLTTDCRTFHVAKVIGPHDGRPVYLLPDEMPGWFDYQCANCGIAHRYMREMLEVKLVDSLPPTDFREWW